MPWEYRLFLVGLGLLYLGVAWVFERHAATPLSGVFGKIKIAATGRQKQRKQYKQIRDGLRTDMM